MGDEAWSFFNLWLVAIAALCYCYFVSSNLPGGKLRLLSLIPVFSLLTYLPLTLSTILPTGISAFFLTWLANFKLLLFSFDAGPLSTSQNSLSTFLIFACLPIKTRPKEPKYREVVRSRLPLLWVAKTVLFAALIVVHDYRDRLPPKATLALLSCMLYLFIDVVLGLCINWVRVVFGIDLELPSDEPYMATSLQDFRGRRWNLIVTETLRHTVYRPLRQAAEAFIGARWAPLLAVLAAFLVSGLMHELLYYQITRAAPTWEVTWFFVFHGLCVAAEVGVKTAAKGRLRLHRAVSGPAAVAFVVVTATWWFYPPLVRNGADLRAVEECKALARWLKLGS